MQDSPDVRPEVPIDWLLAVRLYGLEVANRIEDIRCALEAEAFAPVSWDQARDTYYEIAE